MKRNLKLSLMITLLGTLHVSNLTAVKSSATLSDELQTAIFNLNAARVEQLLNQGADPNAELKGAYKVTWQRGPGVIAPPQQRFSASPDAPIFFAIESHSPAIVKLLLEAGADPNTKNFRGKSALESAKIWLKSYVSSPHRQNFKPQITNLREIVDILRNFKR